MKNIGIIYACIITLSFASCKVKKTIDKTAVLNHQKEQIAFDKIAQNQSTLKHAQANALFEINHQGKTIKSKAEIAIIADSCIQISIRPLLGIEVFRAGIMPHGIILLDRLNGQYCQLEESELKQYTGMTTIQLYNLLQAAISGTTIGWDLLPLKKGDIANYKINIEDNQYTLITQQGIISGFKQRLKNNKLIGSDYNSPQNNIELSSTIEYNEKENSTKTPLKTLLKGKLLNSNEQARLELYNYKTERKPSINLQIPKSYQSKTIKELIQSI